MDETGELPPRGQSISRPRDGKDGGGSPDIGRCYTRSLALRAAAGRQSGRDAIGSIKKKLLEVAGQLAAPHQARRGHQRLPLDPGRDHLMIAGGLGFVCLRHSRTRPDAMTRAGQYRGGPASGGREGQGYRQRIPERH